MGFSFLSVTACAGVTLAPPPGGLVHQSKLHLQGFQSLKEGEAVEFTSKKSAKGLESIWVTSPAGVFCTGGERGLNGKDRQKRSQRGTGATTMEIETTTPRRPSCHPSPRRVTSARAVGKVGRGWVGGRWLCPVSQARVRSITPFSLSAGEGGGVRPMNSNHALSKLLTGVLGTIPPCCASSESLPPALQLFKVAWIGKLFSFQGRICNNNCSRARM